MSNTKLIDRSAFVPAIEPLRAFAAFSVLMLHVIYLGNWTDFPKTGPLAWFWVGWLGVDIFFMISGYVVTMAAFREKELSETPRLNFFIKRVARILPLYYLSMAVYLFAVNSDPVKGSSAFFQILTHLSFTHNLFSSSTGSINPPTWSIGAEMQLYLLVLVLMSWLPRYRPWIFAFTMFAIAIACRYVAYVSNVGASDAILSHYNTQIICGLDNFGMGMVLALLKQKGRLPQVSAARGAILFGGAILGLVACQQILAAHSQTFWTTWWLPTFFRSFAAIFCALLVYAAVAMPDRLQSSIPKVFLFLGKISYGIYLWHFIVIMLLLKYAALGRMAFLASTLLLTVAMAAISWRFIEKPIVKATQQWLSKRSRSEV